MEIDVSNLKEMVKKYENIIERYENTMLNLYHSINNSSAFWVDKKAGNYYEQIDTDKKQLSLIINSMKDLMKVYKFIIEKYEKFGPKIKLDSNMMQETTKKRDYNELIVDKNMEELLALYNISDKVDEKPKNNKKKTDKKEIIKIIQDTLNELDEIETEITKKIDNVDIEFIKEISISDFI